MLGTGRAPELGDRAWLSAALPVASRPPSEYAFANLFLFRARHRYRIVDRPIPHLSGVTYDGLRHALPLTPLHADVVDMLLADHECLFPFGGEAIELADRLGLACRFEDADSDYIYDAARLSTLAGAKLRRSQARGFEAEQAPRLDRCGSGAASAFEQVLEGWLADVAREAAVTDVAECREAIAMIDPLGLDAALVRTGRGEAVAFLLATPRTDGEHVVHFAKGRRAYAGAYSWMFSRYAALSGAARLNFEQDLGNPGFAQSKRAYAPMERRAKYRLLRR